eukprot:CAMPEP_0178496392 /NCGR_PEP_ID=MMETSP0696-20121128/14092_1 /TAXON_ID=265572 /ORGANISM="Extubocellulus spinifer, Strain CCMP396" /LENGTH=190 /DNA_ID=CAMNT_0020124671 /DNA_START=46 /DNA_END=618 /DNA_ORIENTATION=-
MYSVLGRNLARSGAKRAATTGGSVVSRSRSSVSNAAARNSKPDVIAIPMPVSEAVRQHAAEAARTRANAAVLAAGAAGVALVLSTNSPALCGGGGVTEEELQHDWDDFMVKSIKPGEDDDDDDDEDDDEDEEEEEEEEEQEAESKEEEETSDDASDEGGEQEATKEEPSEKKEGEMSPDYKKKWKKAMFK